MWDLVWDCQNEILGFLDIISLVKFRYVSKYMQTLANSYIDKNEKKCDTMAFDTKYLLTPEYLIFYDKTYGTKYEKLKNIFMKPGLNYGKKYNYIATIINHINKFYDRLRLIKTNKNFKFKNCGVKFQRLNMLNLKYLFTNYYGPPISKIYTPRIEYCSDGCGLDSTKYNIKKIRADYISNKKYNKNITKLYTDSHFKFLEYYPNIKILFIDYIVFGSIDYLHRNITKVIINNTYRFTNEAFPDLRKLNVCGTNNFNIGNINVKYMKNIETQCLLNSINVVDYNTIKISGSCDIDLALMVDGLENVYVYNEDCKFIIRGIIIKYKQYEKQLKKFIFN